MLPPPLPHQKKGGGDKMNAPVFADVSPKLVKSVLSEEVKFTLTHALDFFLQCIILPFSLLLKKKILAL